jgi:hypothetical protein
MKELFYFLQGSPKDVNNFLKEYKSLARNKDTKFWVEQDLSASEAADEWGSEVENPKHRVFLVHADVADSDFKDLELDMDWMER